MKDRLTPIIVFGLIAIIALGLVGRHFRSAPSPSGLPIDRLMRLPVLEGGRIKPLDTVARATLMVISQKQFYRDEAGQKIPATEWLAELMLDPAHATQRKIFRIDHPDVVGLLGFHNEDHKFFSLAEISPHFDTLEQQFALIEKEPQRRSAYERELVKLRHSVILFDGIANSLVLPSLFGEPTRDLQARDKVLSDLNNLSPDNSARSTAGNAWQMMINHFQDSDQSSVHAVFPSSIDAAWNTVARALQIPHATDETIMTYAQLAEAYRKSDTTAFGAAMDRLENLATIRVPSSATEDLGLEFTVNRIAPFVIALELYVLVLLCAFLGWLFLPRWLIPAALALLIAAFLIHTFGLVARMDIQNRPPVTNLYSSAIFIGWGSVLICVLLESFLRNGVASVAAALIGFPTLIIAHHLSFSGDTMEVMRAVLDSNFWLATHVVVVALGYSATFLAGVLAINYLILDRVVGGRSDQSMLVIDRMVYGVICFALLFSFVGTILGGVWADQSWGRFWGWDPKENGALMIVLWNAVILHARWSKIASTTAIMQLAVLGNVITAWSWFGTNLLGVGLHSYGFTDSGFFWLMIFLCSQVVVISLGILPLRPRLKTTA